MQGGNELVQVNEILVIKSDLQHFDKGPWVLKGIEMPISESQRDDPVFCPKSLDAFILLLCRVINWRFTLGSLQMFLIPVAL